MADIPYIVFGLLVVILNLVPFSWQVAHHNAGPICLGFWVLASTLCTSINAIVWRNDAVDRAPVLCDISAKLFIGSTIGIICANICIVRFLARVLSPSQRLMTQRDRRNNAILEYCFSLGFPALVMALHILYQPSRYAVTRTLGCTGTYVLSWPTWAFWLVWLPVLAFIGAIFAVYVIYRLIKQRRDLRSILDSAKGSTSAITVSRFMRLTALSAVYFGLQLPLSIYSVTQYVRASGGYIDYDYSYIHSNFHFILLDPFTSSSRFSDWINIMAGMLMLIFFGFAGEATSYYKKIFYFLGGRHLVTLCQSCFSRRRRSVSTDSADLVPELPSDSKNFYFLSLRSSEKGAESDLPSTPRSSDGMSKDLLAVNEDLKGDDRV